MPKAISALLLVQDVKISIYHCEEGSFTNTVQGSALLGHQSQDCWGSSWDIINWSVNSGQADKPSVLTELMSLFAVPSGKGSEATSLSLSRSAQPALVYGSRRTLCGCKMEGRHSSLSPSSAIGSADFLNKSFFLSLKFLVFWKEGWYVPYVDHIRTS